MMWWLIIVGVLLLLLLFKFKEIRHKIGLTFVIVLLVFLVVSFGQLYASNDLDLTTFDGVMKAGKVYTSWLSSAIGNIAKVSTYAVKQDWGMNSSITGK